MGLGQIAQQQNQQLVQGLTGIVPAFQQARQAQIGQQSAINQEQRLQEQSQRQQTEFEQRIVQSEQSEARAQRQSDMKFLDNFKKTVTPILTELSKTSPELVTQVAEGFKKSPEIAGILEKFNLQDIEFFSPQPGLIAFKLSGLPIDEKTRAEIKERSGFDPGPNAIVNIESDGQGNMRKTFTNESKVSALKSNPDLFKKFLDLQAKGARMLEDVKDVDINLLPETAIIELGLGDQKIRMLKPPPKLSLEDSTKLALLQEGRQGFEELLADLQSGKLDPLSLNIASFTGALTPEIQQTRAKLILLREGLARALSGAAVPETEVDRFTTMFSIDKTDTPETILFKIKRSIEITSKIEQLHRFGAPLKNRSISADLDIAQKEIRSKGESSIPSFNSEQEVQEAINQGLIKQGDTIKIGDDFVQINTKIQ